jgi:FKBP-type peptidyl-prolyl cis-trans isomerase FklB
MNLKRQFTLKVIPAVALLALSASSAMAQQALTTSEDKLSYTIGADIGTNFKEQHIQIKPEVFLAGLQDGLSGQKLQLTDAEMKDVLKAFQKEMMAKKMAEFKTMAADNKKAGDDFLAANKKKDGVVTLPDGLQYKVIKAGSGAKPTKTDSVTVGYTGMLINGKVFDSTEGKKPVTFNVNQVIPGWTEALQLMSPGGEMEVYIPSSLAYGPKGVGGPIGPNETLIFKIKLISVNKAPAAKK